MYRELIDHLAFVYGFIAKGRGLIEGKDMRRIRGGAHAMVENAPAVLASGDVTAQDERELGECGLMLEHIDEMVVYFEKTEIV